MNASAPRLGAADTAWWRMEEPTNQMVITAVLTFGGRVDAGLLERRVRERMLPLAPFRCRLREPPLGIGRPRWAPDPAFSLERHLLRVTLPAPAGDAELQALVSRVMSEPLDPAHPLWRFILVENHAGGSALVARLHHCIADGMALIQLLLTLDDVPGNEGPAHLASHNHAHAAPRGSASGRAAPPVRGGARMAGPFAAALARLLLLAPDPRTPLAGRLARVRTEMRRLKASCEAGVTYTLLRVLGPAGRALVRFAVWLLGMKASLVFTDVPGPREPVSICGAPLTRLMAWVPQSGRLSVGISAVSYAGRLQVGIAADRGLVPDPQALVDAFRLEIRDLVALAPAPAAPAAPLEA